MKTREVNSLINFHAICLQKRCYETSIYFSSLKKVIFYLHYIHHCVFFVERKPSIKYAPTSEIKMVKYTTEKGIWVEKSKPKLTKFFFGSCLFYNCKTRHLNQFAIARKSVHLNCKIVQER